MKKVGVKWESTDSGIYKITCLATNKIYIGSSCQIGKRYARHKRELNSCQHYNKHLQRAYDKYGADNFTFEIIDFCDRSMLINTEQFYITTLNPTNIEIGYNRSATASHASGFKHTEETRARLVEAAKHKIYKNKPTKETQAKATEAVRRKVDSYFKGEKVLTHSSGADAARHYSIPYGTVTTCCSNKSTKLTSIKDVYFRYTDGGSAKKLNYKDKK